MTGVKSNGPFGFELFVGKGGVLVLVLDQYFKLMCGLCGSVRDFG